MRVCGAGHRPALSGAPDCVPKLTAGENTQRPKAGGGWDPQMPGPGDTTCAKQWREKPTFREPGERVTGIRKERRNSFCKVSPSASTDRLDAVPVAKEELREAQLS